MVPFLALDGAADAAPAPRLITPASAAAPTPKRVSLLTVVPFLSVVTQVHRPGVYRGIAPTPDTPEDCLAPPGTG
jgi:hypothetical protein